MLTIEDIQKIIEANKEVFYNKEETDKKFNEIKEMFSDLQTAVDAYAKKADAYFQEMVVLNHRISRLEEWAKQIANKIGIKLEY